MSTLARKYFRGRFGQECQIKLRSIDADMDELVFADYLNWARNRLKVVEKLCTTTTETNVEVLKGVYDQITSRSTQN